MRLRVRVFGALRSAIGADHTTVEIAESATVRDVIDAVAQTHPGVSVLLDTASVAVNLEKVDRTHRITAGDEVAILPPVAGGAVRVLTGLRPRPSVEEAMAAVASPASGATVVFVGTVRDHSDFGDVDGLEYSAYEAMAVRELERIAAEISGRWPLEGIALLHAVGSLDVGDPTIVVACSSGHRHEAFEACRYGLEAVKERVPVWKLETGAGGERWIATDRPADPLNS